MRIRPIQFIKRLGHEVASVFRAGKRVQVADSSGGFAAMMGAEKSRLPVYTVGKYSNLKQCGAVVAMKWVTGAGEKAASSQGKNMPAVIVPSDESTLRKADLPVKTSPVIETASPKSLTASSAPAKTSAPSVRLESIPSIDTLTPPLGTITKPGDAAMVREDALDALLTEPEELPASPAVADAREARLAADKAAIERFLRDAGVARTEAVSLDAAI